MSKHERYEAALARNAEYERVLREVLKVIDAMQAPDDQVFDAFTYEGMDPEDEDRVVNLRTEYYFGLFETYGITNIDGADVSRPVVVEWPDLAWAKDQIVKVLGRKA